ncbi:MAG TPA: fasciclin domain-containing protein [Candidatus Thermoplasmatota archaeon]|nr:fasciclin domain-containing protein [Candidatus Thermoplasmatota archaeon]
MRKKGRINMFLLFFVVFLGSMLLAGCFDEENTAEPKKNIVETLTDNSDDFSVLLNALNATGFKDTLTTNSSSFTLLAPTNEAFNKLDGGYLLTLFNKDTDSLRNILSYHTLLDVISYDQFSDGLRMKTLQGKYVNCRVDEENKYIDDATITTKDIMCTNGVIHAIDTVLYPEKNIAETIQSYTILTTFTSLVQSTELNEQLNNEDFMFTVFVPTDDAFSSLNESYLENLTEHSSQDLLTLLSNHILSEQFEENDFTNGMNIETTENTKIKILLDDGEITVNNATIISSDIPCSNGVIHIIDRVLFD